VFYIRVVGGRFGKQLNEKEMQENENELFLFPYDGTNGILIYCKSCGREFEETLNGQYEPIRYESDKYNRQCKECTAQ